jgi:N6-L-threonylcarbamoyladenine synthase
MRVLGIESSCDETSASVVEYSGGVYSLLSNVTATSLDLHAVYGGVVPEIAARSHIEHIIPCIDQALEVAKTDWDEVDAIAVTYGPGLGGSLLVGVSTARTLAVLKNKPLYAVNHVQAHPLATFITSSPLGNYKLPKAEPEFPMLSLIVSGGHSQLVLFESAFDYQILGQTGDDAIGEAYDKVAKIVGLPYPGGPAIEKFAPNGDAHKFNFPKSKLANPYDFSFSGVKTAVLRTAQALIGEDHSFPSKNVAERLSEGQKADIVASFQRIATETVVDKTIKAYQEFQPRSVVIAGGVAASGELRHQLDEKLPIKPIYTDMKLCTDNGAMIAITGCMMHDTDQSTADPYSLEISPSLSM